MSSYIEVTTSGQNTDSLVDESELQQMAGSMIDQRHSPSLVPESAVTAALAVLRGLILTFILVALYRMRRTMLWVKAVFAVVALFTVFLFIDGIVSGPAIADVGLVGGATLVLGAFLLYERWRHTPSQVTN